jgi:hypothetical protein
MISRSVPPLRRSGADTIFLTWAESNKMASAQQQLQVDARERARRAAQAALSDQCERAIMRREMGMLECYHDAWACYALGLEERWQEEQEAAGRSGMGGGARPYPLPPSSPQQPSRAIDQMRTRDAEERILGIAERLTTSLGAEAWQFHAQRAGEVASVPLHWLRQLDDGVAQLQRAAQSEPALRRELASERVRADAAEELAARLEGRNEDRERQREQERQRERAELEEALLAGNERERALRSRIRALKQRLAVAFDDVEGSASNDDDDGGSGSGSDDGVGGVGQGVGRRVGGGHAEVEEVEDYLPFDGGGAGSGGTSGDGLAEATAAPEEGVAQSPSWWSRMLSRGSSSSSSACKAPAAAAAADADADDDGGTDPPKPAAEAAEAEEAEASHAGLLDSSSSRVL